MSSKRIESVDFIKCVCIILMVMFHLAYFTDKYPVAKHFVYLFHMPIFLFLSGYFLNTAKSGKEFLVSSMRILIPYLVMEILYVVFASFLPTRDAVESLSFSLIIDKLFLHPLGPYWYLHTILITSTISFVTSKVVDFLAEKFSSSIEKLKPIAVVLLLIVIPFGTNIVEISNVYYYAIGYILSYSKLEFDKFVRPSFLLSLLAIVMIVSAKGITNICRDDIVSRAIVYGMMSFMVALYNVLPQKINAFCTMIGRNTLSILLFSPIFTMASKLMIPYLSFDSTRLIFMLIATSLSVLGSILIAKFLEFILRKTFAKIKFR